MSSEGAPPLFERSAQELRPLSEVALSDETVWSLVDSAPDALVMADLGGHIVLVNRQAELMFGYDRGELLGQTVDVLLPGDRRGVHRAHRTRFRVEPAARVMGAELELRGCRRDGSLFPVEITLSSLADTGGDPLFISAVRDVSDRVAAESLAREVRHGLDVVEDGVFMFEAESLRFRYVNRGAVDQVGYSAAELLTMTPVHLKPQFTEASFRALLAPVLAGEVPSVHVTTLHRRKDGNDIPVEIVVQAVSAAGPDGGGTCVALVREIRERIEHERALAEAQRQASIADDRERLARDLHDTVIQELFATGMHLQSVVGRIDDELVANRVLESVDAIDGAISQLRGAIFGLTRHSRWGRGVRGEILAVADSAISALGFEPVVDFEGDIDGVPAEVVQQLLPVVREALSNVARHAEASRAGLLVAMADGEICVEVLDNGSGVSGTASGELNGHGLRNMSERARGLGGTCTVVPRDGGGTRVEWRVPSPIESA
ncbi:MAG: PAS domain S-box protein [Actinomycetia bacterium]|nr:PAS domain S-box protein [Actinomycetes bacterium]